MWQLCCRETDPEWEKDIEAETKDECSKYGTVLHVHVDKNSKARPGPRANLTGFAIMMMCFILQKAHSSNFRQFGNAQSNYSCVGNAHKRFSETTQDTALLACCVLPSGCV